MKRKILLLSLLLILLLTSFFIYYNVSFSKINSTKDQDINKSENSIEDKSSDSSSSDNVITDDDHSYDKNEDIKNIALFGIDETDDNTGRSDCIIILTIDNKNDKIKLSSLMRDSYVSIPDKPGKDKINHAYAFGGPELAVKTINENFGLDISDYISVNLSSFPKLIDQVGGLELNITDDELKYINNYINSLNKRNNTNSQEINEPGKHLVDGTQCLAYLRIRYTAGGDFERTHRQRTVLKCLYSKLKSLPITEYPKILDTASSLIKTNLDYSYMLSIAKDLAASKYQDISENRFPTDEDGYGSLINNIYYFVFDDENTKEKIHQYIYN